MSLNVKQKNLSKLKTPFFISSFNKRTLDAMSKKYEIAYLADKYQFDVICIQEHRISHTETLLQENLFRHTLVTSSCTKNSINASIGGVGFLLSHKVLKCRICIEKISDRITKIDLGGNSRTSIRCCYSPTKVSSDQEIQSFYYTLINTVSNIPAHSMLFIAGDFNAKIGQMEAFYSFNSVINRNGKQLTDFIYQFNIIATNTGFKNRLRKLWTHIYPNGTMAQLDYILANEKWRNSIKDTCVYNNLDSIGSDWGIVTCKGQISY